MERGGGGGGGVCVGGGGGSYLSLAERGVPRSIAVPSSSHGTRRQSGRREAADLPPPHPTPHHHHHHPVNPAGGALGLGVWRPPARPRGWRRAEEEEERWWRRRGRGPFPSRAEPSGASPDGNPKERGRQLRSRCAKLRPCLTGNFGFTGGGGRGEGRREAEAEGAGSPAGAGSREEPGQPRGVGGGGGPARMAPTPGRAVLPLPLFRLRAMRGRGEVAQALSGSHPRVWKALRGGGGEHPPHPTPQDFAKPGEGGPGLSLRAPCRGGSPRACTPKGGDADPTPGAERVGGGRLPPRPPGLRGQEGPGASPPGLRGGRARLLPPGLRGD